MDNECDSNPMEISFIVRLMISELSLTTNH